MPVVDATPASLEGYGRLVEGNPEDCRIEIVRWPAQGTRPVDAGTGDQGGTTTGVFASEWRGDILYGRNDAVGGHYILAYAQPPEIAREDHSRAPERMMLWHANYHPDGGQLFFPLEREPYYVPLALPGDDISPQQFVCFRVAATAASTCIRMSGTRARSGCAARSDFSTGRELCTRASRWTSRANSAACSRPPLP